MKMNHTKKIVLSALFAALTCVCTMSITIPTPTGGYVHAGDCFVILSGVFLGPIVGGLAGGIGSMLSDAFLGYFAYVPATFIIKFLAAFLAGILYKYLRKYMKSTIMRILMLSLCGLISSIVVIVGYFFYEWLLTDNVLSAAISSILGNSMQGFVSIILSCLLYSIIPKGVISNQTE